MFLRTTQYSLILFATLFCSTIYAQLPNGTITTLDYFTEVIANLPAEQLENVDTLSPELDVQIMIEVFVVMNESGESEFASSILNDNMDIVNSFFSKIGIQFMLGNIAEIPEYSFNKIDSIEDVNALETRYALPNKINLFLVNEIELDDTPSYGFTYDPIDSIHNVIFMRKDYVFGHNLCALLGSYFGLMQTHEKVGGQEFVDGSNCSVAGDIICDTWADPGFLFLGMNDNCQYLGGGIDPKGDTYLPTVTNIMSDSPDECKCIFTLEQYQRMKFYYKYFRLNLH